MKNKKKLTILAATVAAMAAASPTSAHQLDEDDLFLLGYYNVMGEVDYENVPESSDLDGQCVAEDVDLDGFIAEWEFTCYY